MKTIQAVFEGGVFRPIVPVTLPEHSQVEFEPRLIEPPEIIPTLDDVYSILQQRFNSGEGDVAARHDEHQP